MSEAVAVEKPRKVKRSKRERAEETPAIEGQIERTSDVSALTQHGWIAGVIGSIMVLVLGFIGARKNVLEKGWGLPFDTTPNKNTSAFSSSNSMS